MISVVRKLQRNTLYSLMSSMVRLSANAVLFVMVARFYGPERFGQFATAHILATVFILLADFGFDMLLTTEIARWRENAAFLITRMLSVKLLFSVTASLLMCAYALVQEMSEGTRNLVYIFSLYLLFSALLNSMYALFKGHEELQHESRITLILNVFLLGSLLVLGNVGSSLYMVAGCFVLSRVLGLTLALAKTKRFVPTVIPFVDTVWLRSVWRKVSVFGIFFIFGNLFFMLDTIMISVLRGDYEVGIYQSVFKMIAIALVVPEILINALLPTLARYYSDERTKWHGIGTAASKTLYYIGLLVGLFLTTASTPIVDLVYGLRDYSEAVPILRIFGGIILVRYAVEIPALMLTTSQRQHVRMFLVVFATLFNFLLNLYAIPRFGIAGAAIVSLLTNILVGLGYIITVREAYKEKWLTRERVVPLSVVLSGGICVWFFPSFPIWIFLILVVLAYVPTVYFTGYTGKEKSLVLEAALGVVSR